MLHAQCYLKNPPEPHIRPLALRYLKAKCVTLTFCMVLSGVVDFGGVPTRKAVAGR